MHRPVPRCALNPYITGTVGEVISAFTLFFIDGATIHLTLMGYAIGWGYVELLFSTFIKTCIKYLFIGALALNASTYPVMGRRQHPVAGNRLYVGCRGDRCRGKACVGLFGRGCGARQGMGIAADLWEKAGNRGITEMGTRCGEYINAAIIVVATGLIGVPTGGMTVVAKAALTIHARHRPGVRCVAALARHVEVLR